MDVVAQNQSAVTKVTDDIRIKYSMSTKGKETLKDITASILNNDTSDG